VLVISLPYQHQGCACHIATLPAPGLCLSYRYLTSPRAVLVISLPYLPQGCACHIATLPAPGLCLSYRYLTSPRAVLVISRQNQYRESWIPITTAVITKFRNNGLRSRSLHSCYATPDNFLDEKSLTASRLSHCGVIFSSLRMAGTDAIDWEFCQNCSSPITDNRQ